MCSAWSRSIDKLPITEQEQRIHKFALENGSISTAQAVELLGVKQRRAREILGKMVDNHWLRKEGASRSTVYVINTERTLCGTSGIRHFTVQCLRMDCHAGSSLGDEKVG